METIAAFDERRRRGPPLGVFEQHDAHGLGGLQVRLTEDDPQRGPELFEPHQHLAPGPRARVRHDFERPGGELHPMVIGREEPRQKKEKEQPLHCSFIIPPLSSGVARARESPCREFW